MDNKWFNILSGTIKDATRNLQDDEEIVLVPARVKKGSNKIESIHCDTLQLISSYNRGVAYNSELEGIDLLTKTMVDITSSTTLVGKELPVDVNNISDVVGSGALLMKSNVILNIDKDNSGKMISTSVEIDDYDMTLVVPGKTMVARRGSLLFVLEDRVIKVGDITVDSFSEKINVDISPQKENLELFIEKIDSYMESYMGK